MVVVLLLVREGASLTLHHGDCLAVLPTLEAESIDAIVTDPPYGLGFMGKAWDHGVPGVAFWAEMLRVAKPGAHLLAFGGTRTVHRIATAIEDAGWEIRDTLVWAYASGFPKSLDVSKAIDKAAGAERPVLAPNPNHRAPATDHHERWNGAVLNPNVTAPATDLAREWQGWGTALKPAWEPIVMARKPLRGTVAGNVTEYGTGALNIDGCRIGTEGGGGNGLGSSFGGPTVPRVVHGEDRTGTLGRWPANVILTDPIFDGDTPGVVGGGAQATQANRADPASKKMGDPGVLPWQTGRAVEYLGDAGTYSRFFLVPKAARSDREPVIASLPMRTPPGWSSGEQSPGTFQSQPTPARQNVHPTVKPTELMRHLVRLVTPPGGTVLDPFLGSGTTALACEAEGFEWVGIEREAEYVAIAEARLNGTQRGLGLTG